MGRHLLAGLLAATAVIGGTALPARPLLAADPTPPPASLTVDKLEDDAALYPCDPGKHCSLRAAISKNGGPGATIKFSKDGVFLLNSQLVIANTNLQIIGNGRGTTIIDGHRLDRVFSISDARVALSALTVQNGKSVESRRDLGGGGGILVTGLSHVTVQDSILQGNEADGNGGSIEMIARPPDVIFAIRAGLAAEPPVSLTVKGSAITGNAACYGGGVSLVSEGTGEIPRISASITASEITENNGRCFGSTSALWGSAPGSDITVENSTISGNQNTETANSEGAPSVIAVSNLNTIALKSSTVADNLSNAGNRAAAIRVDQGSNATLENTIVRTPKPGINCLGIGVVSLGHNLTTDASCGSNKSDLTNADPMLGELKNNGGPTRTHALRHGSHAIDAPGETRCPQTDQRGRIRQSPKDAKCDIGAYEAQPVAITAKPVCSAPNQGGDNYAIEVDGADFTPRVRLFFAGQPAGIASPDDKGHFKTKINPPRRPPGSYEVKALGGAEEVATANFQEPCAVIRIDPACDSAGSDADRYTINVEGTGFLANHPATISFAGSKVATVDVDKSGHFFTRINPAKRSAGSYEVKVEGDGGVGVATASFGVPCPPPPTISVAPVCGPAASDAGDPYQITVEGKNFPPGRFGLTFADQTVGDVVVEKNGQFKTVITPGRKPPGSYPVKVLSQSGTVLATAPFGVPCAPPPAVHLAPTCGAAATGGSDTYSITVEGNGFKEGQASILFGGDQAGAVSVDASGKFRMDIHPPRRSAGTYPVKVLDSSGGSASADFGVPCPPPPAIKISPTCALAAGGTDNYSIGIDGTGFAPGQVRLSFAGNDMGTTTVDSKGNFNTTITPRNQPAGTYQVKAVDGDGTAAADFAVPCQGTTSTPTPSVSPSGTPTPTPTGTPRPSSSTPTPSTTPPACGSAGRPACPAPKLVITPTTGPAGFTTSVIGTGFPANSTVSLRWDRGLTPADMNQVATDGNGGFTIQTLIFPHDVLGRRTLKATAAPGTQGSPTASATYLVVLGSGQPPEISSSSGSSGEGLVFRH
jgi:hypothetical protein